jgi:hypothetical protein
VGNEVFQFKQHLLEFEGLDTIAVVTLNDVVIGNASNMFRRYVFNVTELLKVLHADCDCSSVIVLFHFGVFARRHPLANLSL